MTTNQGRVTTNEGRVTTNQGRVTTNQGGEGWFCLFLGGWCVTVFVCQRVFLYKPGERIKFIVA